MLLDTSMQLIVSLLYPIRSHLDFRLGCLGLEHAEATLLGSRLDFSCQIDITLVL